MLGTRGLGCVERIRGLRLRAARNAPRWATGLGSSTVKSAMRGQAAQQPPPDHEPGRKLQGCRHCLGHRGFWTAAGGAPARRAGLHCLTSCEVFVPAAPMARHTSCWHTSQCLRYQPTHRGLLAMLLGSHCILAMAARGRRVAAGGLLGDRCCSCCCQRRSRPCGSRALRAQVLPAWPGAVAAPHRWRTRCCCRSLRPDSAPLRLVWFRFCGT
jgi:hypothetical protein